jgi:hypothetical protein
MEFLQEVPPSIIKALQKHEGHKLEIATQDDEIILFCKDCKIDIIIFFTDNGINWSETYINLL